MEPSHFRAAEDDPKADRARDRRGVARFSPAVKFVLMVGVMSFFADFTYEGSRSIIGQYLGLLGAGALAISVVTGFGELLGYGLRLFSGRGADRTLIAYHFQRSGTVHADLTPVFYAAIGGAGGQ
jgi:hypothetical protein